MRKLKSCQKRETRTTTAYKEEENAGTCGNRKFRARSRETGRLQTAGFELMRDGTRSASYKNEAICSLRPDPTAIFGMKHRSRMGLVFETKSTPKETDLDNTILLEEHPRKQLLARYH